MPAKAITWPITPEHRLSSTGSTLMTAHRRSRYVQAHSLVLVPTSVAPSPRADYARVAREPFPKILPTPWTRRPLLWRGRSLCVDRRFGHPPSMAERPESADLSVDSNALPVRNDGSNASPVAARVPPAAAGERVLLVTWRRLRLSFIKALLRAHHIRVARIKRQRVGARRLSLRELLDLELPHPATAFSRMGFGAHHPIDDGARRRCLLLSS
jgi:hypothetical protein